ncbi:mitochondrial inner-membrane-bound regulator-domain-containing protein [Scheffersomyces coipomensis]|uniref:mitochondrial inner-membrane-bound regulator-domain-containing protein n=1 Tax=Scheffersomyces coipomensis TaxID=1788519 RepID=UPI00315D3BED
MLFSRIDTVGKCRILACRGVRTPGLRYLSTFHSLGYDKIKHIIPEVIHKELQDTSKLAPKVQGRNKRIFLSPSEISDKGYEKYVQRLNSSKSVKRVIRKEDQGDFLSDEILQFDQNSHNIIKDLKLEQDLENQTSSSSSSSTSNRSQYLSSSSSSRKSPRKQSRTSLNSSIDKLKPLILKISKKRSDKLIKDIDQAYTKRQLQDYLTTNYALPEFSSKKKSINRTKPILIERIFKDIWNVEVVNFRSFSEDYLSESSFKLSKKDLFILLSNNQEALEHIQNCGAEVKFDSNKDTIKFVGSSSQITNAEINLNSILGSAFTETIDFTIIKQILGNEKYDNFAQKLVKITDVYFHHINDEVYELTSLHVKQLKRFKRLVLWSLAVDRHRHLKKDLFIPQSSLQDITSLNFLPYKDDMAVSWNNRSENLFKLRTNVKSDSLRNNEMLLKELNKFSNDALESTDLSFQDEFEQIKNVISPQNAIKSDEEALSLFRSTLELDNNELLDDIKEQEQEQQEEIIEEEIISSSQESIQFNLNNTISDSEVDKLYDFLVDFKYRNELKGVEEDNLNSPIFVATLGHILFKGEDSNSERGALIPRKPIISSAEDVSQLRYDFNTNVELANSKVLSYPLQDWSESSISKSNHFLSEDPQTYVIQLQFLPAVSFGNVSEINQHEDGDNIVKYPPIEIWINLNEKKIPDLDTFQAVTVEGENNSYVSLPSFGSDIKVSCQLSGNLLTEEEEVIEETQADDVEVDKNEEFRSILSATTSRNNRFKSQPGISKWLKKSTMNFRGKVPISIHPDLNIIINGETIKYNFISINYRRKLEFNLDDTTTIELNSVEGGELGGRKVEINFTGDMSQDINKPQFKQLLTDVTKFISEL